MFAGHVKIESLVLQDQCNIEIFLSTAMLKKCGDNYKDGNQSVEIEMDQPIYKKTSLTIRPQKSHSSAHNYE